MHELAIANSIFQTVLNEVALKKLPPVTLIALRIGALSDVVPEALEFNFSIICRDSPLERAKLEIERVPLNGKCQACEHEFAVEKYVFVCPTCKSGQITVTQGEELDIAYIEVEDNVENET